MEIFLVEDTGNSPGKIYAIFAKEIDADMFGTLLRQRGIHCDVVPRMLRYRVPTTVGYNP